VCESTCLNVFNCFADLTDPSKRDIMTLPSALTCKTVLSIKHFLISIYCFRNGYLPHPPINNFLISLISSLTTPLTPVNMPLERLLNIAQTPLILTLRLTQRHHEILLSRLLLICRTLALCQFLLLALRRCGLVVCFAVALGHCDFLFLGRLLAE
jgi:hypothetical protein